MTDIEKTTISVKNLVLVMSAVIGVCISIMGGGMAASWWTANQLSNIHSSIDKHTETLTTLKERTDDIAKNQEIAKAYTDSALIARRAIVLPSRWTMQMQAEFERELEDHFRDPSHVSWPDVQKIHDQLAPFAP